MQHAEVLLRLVDAAAEPGGIARLADPASSDPDAVALQQHLATCADCRGELVAWQRTANVLAMAAPGAAEAITAPPDARARVLANVLRLGQPTAQLPDAPPPLTQPPLTQPPLTPPPLTPPPLTPPPLTQPPVAQLLPPPGQAHAYPPSTVISRGPRSHALQEERRPLRFRYLALAAAVVLAVFVAGAYLGRPLGLVPPDRSAAGLAAAVAASDTILRQPAHREAVLLRGDGTDGGSVLVDPATGAIAVFSTDLGTAGEGEYGCYLVRDGSAPTWIGPMHTQEGTAYWAGTVTVVEDFGRPGDVIQVRDGGDTPELTASF